MTEPKEEAFKQDSENLDRVRRKLLRLVSYVPPAILVLPLTQLQPPQTQLQPPPRLSTDVIPITRIRVTVDITPR